VVIGAELLADLLAQEAPDRLAGHAADHFAEQITDVDGVVGAVCAGRPRGLLLFERLDVLLPTEPGAGRGAVAIDHAAGVRQDVADKDPLFAGLREFRPVVGDGRVEVDLAAIDENVHAQCAHAFRERVHDDDGVFFPRHSARDVFVSAPKIDDFLAVLVDADRCADFTAAPEIIGKCFLNCSEFGCAGALDA
jgi:hypothetical protein